MEGSAIKDFLAEIFGKPLGIVIYQLLGGAEYTIILSLTAFVGGGLIALIVALAGIPSKKKWINRASAIYVWTFQSVPLLMLLFLLGLGVPRLLGVDISAWVAAGIAMVLYSSAYLGEVWRGAIAGLPHGQWDAGRALGLNFFKILYLIVAPQALRLAIAPTVGFMVQIIKGTSLAYIIGFYDLMSVGKQWANAPVKGTEPFVIYPLVALIYFSLCFPLSVYARRLERKFSNQNSRGPAVKAAPTLP